MPDKPLILMIDDDEFAIATLQALLQSENYKFLTAVNGQDGFTKAKEYQPDLILLDIMMPEMDGFTLCKKIRQEKDIAESTIVIITALDDKESKLEGFEAGADDFITKPFDKVELKLRIQTILKLNRFRKLSMERERFKSVFDDFPRAIFLLDYQGIIKEINNKAKEIFHYASLVNLEIKDLLHPAFRDHFLQTLSTLTPTHTRTNVSVLFAIPGQEPFATEIFLLRLVIADEVFYQVLIKNEATDPFYEANSRTSLQFFQEMTNSIGLVDQHYHLLSANPAMLALLGYARVEEAKDALQEWFCLDQQRIVAEPYQNFTIRLVPFQPAKQSQHPEQECLFYSIQLSVPGKTIFLLMLTPTGEEYLMEKWESKVHRSLSDYLESTSTKMDLIMTNMMALEPTGPLFKNYWEGYQTAVSPLVNFLYQLVRLEDKSQGIPGYASEPVSLHQIMMELDTEISHDSEWNHPSFTLSLKPTPPVMTNKKLFKEMLRSWLYFLPPSLVNHAIHIKTDQSESLACLDIQFDPTERPHADWQPFWNSLFYRKPPHKAHPEDAYFLLHSKKLMRHLGGDIKFHLETESPIQHLLFCFPLLQKIEK